MSEFTSFMDASDLYGSNDATNENLRTKVDGMYRTKLLWLDIYVQIINGNISVFTDPFSLKCIYMFSVSKECHNF